jgi:hypothetical protein
MNDDKVALYESLIRASLVLIFFIALTAGVVGTITISKMLMHQAIHNSGFIDTEAVAIDTER